MREIKSFAKRRRKLTPRQSAAFSYSWDEKGIEFSGEQFDLDKIFGRSADRVLEIGFGDGNSLWQMAKENSDKDYLAIEVHTPGIANLLACMVEHDVENIRIIQDDAVKILNEAIADNTFSRVQIFFPDPWPKKRHHKRRLIQPEFVELVKRKLKVGGVLHCATDWENYAEHMMDVLTNTVGFENCLGKLQYADNEDMKLRPNTKFEQRGVALGHGVWDLLFRKL